MDMKAARQFLDLLGFRPDLARIERIPHPDKRNHWAYRAAHPSVGEVLRDDEKSAWHALCDLAENAGPRPDWCQAKTSSGKPCRNPPQQGERYCGAHLVNAEASPSSTSLPGMCQAKTKKGRPCQNAPQKGEIYCGPHLSQAKG